VKIDLDTDLLSNVTLRGLKVSPLQVINHVGRYDLHLMMTETTEGLHGTLVYDLTLFEETTISRICEQLKALLQKIAEEPGARLAELQEVLDEAERQHHLAAETDYRQSIQQKFKQARQRATIEAS
jgi:non-ribosomal peptide synthetase component F